MSGNDGLGLVFIHGAGLGGWIWEGMSSALRSPHVFADFPGRDGDADVLPSLRLGDYADHIVKQIAELPAGRLVIVAHSLGGVVGLKVADQLAGRVAGFVAVGAAIPPDGGSFVSALPVPKRWVVGGLMRLLGTKPPDSAIRQGLCSDLSTDRADEVVRRFVPEGRAVYFERTGVAVPQVPRRYVRLTEDKESDQRTQLAMARNLGADDVCELSAGHLPMLSRPRQLAGLLNQFVAELAEQPAPDSPRSQS